MVLQAAHLAGDDLVPYEDSGVSRCRIKPPSPPPSLQPQFGVPAHRHFPVTVGWVCRSRSVASFPEDLPKPGDEGGELEGLLEVSGRRVPQLGSCLPFGQPREK